MAKVLRMDGSGQISEDNSAVFPVGTRWSLSGSLGDRSQSTHTYGIDLLGNLSFGESLYLTFEAAQIEYDNGDSNSRSWWSVSVENETPDNSSEARTLISNTSFNELSLSVGPWWSADHTPPFGTTLIPSGGSSFSLSLSSLEGGLFLQGYVDRMVVAVPEPTAAFLAGVSGLWLISRRRRLLKN